MGKNMDEILDLTLPVISDVDELNKVFRMRKKCTDLLSHLRQRLWPLMKTSKKNGSHVTRKTTLHTKSMRAVRL